MSGRHESRVTQGLRGSASESKGAVQVCGARGEQNPRARSYAIVGSRGSSRGRARETVGILGSVLYARAYPHARPRSVRYYYLQACRGKIFLERKAERLRRSGTRAKLDDGRICESEEKISWPRGG